MGRDPAAVGLLADGAAARRLPARAPRDQARAGGARALHGRGSRRLPRRRRAGRREPAPGSVPVAGVGHGAVDARAERRGRRGGPSGDARRRASGCSARRSPNAATGRCAAPRSSPAAGRSSSPTSTIPTSTTPSRSCWRSRASTSWPRCERRSTARSARALRWVEGMQSADGGWGAFDVDNTRSLVRELPFLDFGEVIDEPSADVTAHTIEMLGALGLGDTPRRAPRRALAARAPGGGRLVVRALGHQPRLRHRRRGARVDRRGDRALASSASGAPSPGSSATRTKTEAGARTRAPTTTPSGSVAGPSTASQTAWALLALHAAGERSPALARGVAWLVATQRVDGGWDEPQYTGTGFPSDYYINYHLYRLTFPVMALGRCLAARRPGGGTSAARAPSDRSDAHSRRADRRPCRGGGDGASADGELPRRQPCAAAPRAPAPDGAVRLCTAGRRAGRRRRAPAD